MVRPLKPELITTHDDCPLVVPRRGARGSEVRCDCGSLLARWTQDGVELKCRRCKRRVVIPVSGLPPRAPPAK